MNTENSEFDNQLLPPVDQNTTKTARFNIFEGARRIAQVITAIAIIIAIISTINNPRDNWLESLGYLGMGLSVFWMIVVAIGWIARGFAGIPNGMDHRPRED